MTRFQLVVVGIFGVVGLLLGLGLASFS